MGWEGGGGGGKNVWFSWFSWFSSKSHIYPEYQQLTISTRGLIKSLLLLVWCYFSIEDRVHVSVTIAASTLYLTVSPCACPPNRLVKGLAASDLL